MLRKLAELGLAEYVPYKGVELSPAGERVALEVIRHHRLIEAFLAETLGMPPDRVHAEAEVLEHYISEDLEKLIAAKLGEPSHDPHGNPIPGPDLPPRPRRRRESAPRGALGSRAGSPRRGGRRRRRPPLARRPLPRPRPPLALPRPGLHRRRRLHRPRQLRHQRQRRGQVRLHAAVGRPRRQPGRDGGPGAVGEARHRHRQKPRRALPRTVQPPHLDLPLAAGGDRRDGLRHRRDRRRLARPQPPLRHPALRRRADHRRRHLHPARPPAPRLPQTRGGDHRPGRRRRRRLRLRALQRLARKLAKSPATSSSPNSAAPKASCWRPASSARR